MSVDPNIDYSSHDPRDDDSEELSEDPRIREAQLLERRMRAALATKENPLSDGESTSDRLKKSKDTAARDTASQDAADTNATAADTTPES